MLFEAIARTEPATETQPMTTRAAFRGRLAEGAVILGSILIAFWIDAWWDGRQEAQLEAAMVSAVVAELDANRPGLELALSRASSDWVNRFIRLTPAGLESMPPDSVWEVVRLVGRNTEHLPLTNSASSLLSTPAVDLTGLEAREVVGRWLQRVADYEVERAGLEVRQDALQRELARHAARVTDEDVGNFVGMIWRSGGSAAVAAMRMDANLMAAMVDMGRSKVVYGGRVSGLLALSDTVKTELRRLSERAP
jgi:hypothetical protein